MPVRETLSLLAVAGAFIVHHGAATLKADENTFTQAPRVAPSRVPGETVTPPPKPPGLEALNDGPAPNWIWGAEDDKTYILRQRFPGTAKAAWLRASCDNRMKLFVNGRPVAESGDWQQAVTVDVHQHLKADNNEIRVEATNAGGIAGFVLKLALTRDDGTVDYVISDDSWTAAESKEAEPVAVRTLGKLGVGPWKDVFAKADEAMLAVPNVFNVLPGFQVELLYTVPKETQGSWVCLALDHKGRILASDQQDKGLYRITPPKPGSTEPTKVEKLDVNITAAQGMLAAFDSLYLSVNGGPGSGFYRARDTDGDDHYDEVTKLATFHGGGEHGPHALRLSPDGKSIFVDCGNHTNPPEKIDASRIPTNWGEDHLLPRQWDANGHARGRLAPGGWIAKTDPDGKTWEIFSIGYRNQYDFAINADGEFFAYDADMEWDYGTPWYRPTRVSHATSGSEFGWRSGTGKWPEYYIDSLPAAVDIGPGSPVGVEFGYGTKFPAKYQKALYILDWTFGTIYALHAEPEGSSYKFAKEEFLSRTPLPLTDAVVGPDGALYFAIGGRGTQSELYRVTYVGPESTAAVDPHEPKNAELRKLRHSIEAYHAKADDPAKAVAFVYPHLKHADRFIRYAARVALEHQPTEHWQDRILAETDPETLINGAVALARQGDKSLQPKLLEALDRIAFDRLDTRQQLDLLRVWSLVFIRMGEPDQPTATQLALKLDPYYPATDDRLNRELCNVLVYLKSPTVIGKTLDLLDKPSQQTAVDMAELLARNARYGGAVAQVLANGPDAQRLHYLFALRNLRYGWTFEQRQKYFEALNAMTSRTGGNSFQGFLKNIRTEALANASEAERKAIESAVPPAFVKPAELPKAQGPGHDWTLDEIVAAANGRLGGRDFENGKKMFAAARCIVCHRFDGVGGATGPDLTNVAGRFSIKDLSESLVDPSKVISDQYKASVVITTAGKVHTGRVVSETKDKIVIVVDPEDATKIVEIAKDDIEELTPSPVSLMPKDLLKTLNQQEVLDLLAYVMSRGNPNDAMFSKSE